MKNKATGGILVMIGYLLSPLSWWNDLILNIPLAYGFASLFSLISKHFFTPMLIIGYWLTNITGLILMHHGAKKILSKGKSEYSKKELLKDLIISTGYTLIIFILITMGWLKPPADLFK